MIYATIIVYNKKILDSITYKCLKDYSDIHLIFFDNSSEEFSKSNREYCSKNGIQYYTLNRNIGLSKAYNYVIKKLKDNANNNDYMIILDDDTNINKEYIMEARKLVSENLYDIILPVVLANNVIISPANIQNSCRVVKVNNINELNDNNITAINSGMIVKLNVYNNILYPEELFLDYVDHAFMREVRKYKYKLKVMDSSIKQNFSMFQKNNIDAELIRFKIYLKDFKTYCKKCNNIKFYYISTMKYRIEKSFKYKSSKFLFC